jgi:uncharacterized protein YecT (DUF1311 family)
MGLRRSRVASVCRVGYNGRMKKTILLALTILAVSVPLLVATGPSKHPIDAWLTACMEQNPSSQGMNGCLGQAYEKWDLELNRVYQELSGKLNAGERAVLREAQRAWIAFRDRELAWLAKFYGGLQGSMYANMLAADRVDLVKRRVMELRSFLDVLAQK